MENNYTYAIEAKNLVKKYKGFELNIPHFEIPKGFTTALIGENGAGKTTLLNMLAGLKLDYKGNIRFFDTNDAADETVKEKIGYTGPGCYFLPQWTIKQVGEISELLFERFDKTRYEEICGELGITKEKLGGKGKKVSDLSDGNRMKLKIAGVLARETQLLIMDEPASPLDPLMRDELCNRIRAYIEQGNGDKTVLCSTHNIADMENVTDYAIIMEHGKIVEEGFVEDLKEKYILIKGDVQDADKIQEYLYDCNKSSYGFEGMILSENLDKLAGTDISTETPTLSQISVAVMRANTDLKLKR